LPGLEGLSFGGLDRGRGAETLGIEFPVVGGWGGLGQLFSGGALACAFIPVSEVVRRGGELRVDDVDVLCNGGGVVGTPPAKKNVGPPRGSSRSVGDKKRGRGDGRPGGRPEFVVAAERIGWT